MGAESPFADLRRLADWFVTSPTRPSLHVERIVQRLGATAVPLLGRELATADPQRRDAAREALARLAGTAARARVIAEVKRITESAGALDDAGKVCALGLLAELGERGVARFADPMAIQRSSALALATQLETPADVASAADLMVHQLAPTADNLLQLVAVLAEAAPGPAHRIAVELCGRLDLAAELRERIAETALLHAPPTDDPSPRRAPRPTHVHVLVDGGARTVIVAIRKVSGERRWRRWAVLFADAQRGIDDCIHEEQAGTEAEAASLVQSLLADGYRIASTELERARELVAAAARTTGADPDGERLLSAYYLGRDLLDLGDAHLSRTRIHPTSATIGRAVELIADGDVPRARLLLARCDAASHESVDVAAAVAACLLAQQRTAEAVPFLVRACELEPAWPLHHWNLAAAYHALGDAAACYPALRRFVATSAVPTGLAGDPDQPARVALAARLMAELERTARLAGRRLGRRRRKP